MKSFSKLLGPLLLIVALGGITPAMAQPEPSMNQIYSTAQAGKLDEAQTMVQQVLISHPQSAKAYFVQAELYARQGKPERAREALNTAESYAPGLPFAKPQAVHALRAQIAATPTPAPGYATAETPKPAAPASASSWALPLLLAVGVIAGAYFFFRRRVPAAVPTPPFAAANGLSGPQTFGTGAGAMQPTYPQNPGGYAAPAAGPSMGSRIAGGLATGLAVGAGVVAAEAIGRSLMGDGHGKDRASSDTLGHNGLEPIADSPDMGGDNFGIGDTSWDDAGGSDWDN